ncbi:MULTISPECIES: ankyrin repeat domain-containing protein [unclassified Synechocystis]|uniref:ankyrin repeat domain-containing protein n=1 Tax=unclassified Synechocystis TaxID=2640012 RepID=UPI00040D6C04|nr:MULTISPECIES: ankyrin repeat domain-containing protein [unclassified Synechocystis]AIE75326.1 Ankyrin [Synechocystis sp. PCC 6714]MCT0253563.1 ankyrin repeat domain-containing protein [Synechocystis sp. CS-94]
MVNPIVVAAKQGQWQLVQKHLFTATLDQVNQRDERGLTALMYGVTALEVPTVKQLLQAGVDPNLSRPPHDITPLMLLAGLPHNNTNDLNYSNKQEQRRENLCGMAKILLEFGAEVNRQNDDGTTALMMAAYRNNLPLVQIFLAGGADCQVQDRQGTTALEWAIKHRNLAMVQALLQGQARLDLRDGDGNLPLTLAIKIDDHDIVDSLLRAGAPWDQESWFTAVEEGKIAPVQALIEAGYPITEPGDTGDTALHIACLEGYEKMVQILLAHQAPLDVVNQAGDTPLILAIAQGQLAIVGQLLKAGANPNFSVTGESPLMTALTMDSLGSQVQREIVQALFKAGVSANQCLWEDKTPLMVAANLNLADLISLLANHGADPNQTDPSGSTALMWACHRGHLEVVKALLDNFPAMDVNVKNNGGQTALHLAHLNHRQAIVAFLKSHPSHGQ